MKNLIPMAIALTIIAGVAAFCLALIFQVTEEPIKQAETQKRIEAINSVLQGIEYANSPVPFPGEAEFVNRQMMEAARGADEEELARFAEDTSEAYFKEPGTEEADVTAPDWFKFGDYWYFIARNQAGEMVGVAARVFSMQGYSGYVETFVGIDNEGKVIGLQVTDHRETPGLGSKVNDPEFKNQFIGNSLSNHTFEVSKSSEPKHIDSIAGATISSRAVADPVRRGLELLRENRGEFPAKGADTGGEE